MTQFIDNFNRPDSTNLGANWTEVQGDWSIVSNELVAGGGGADHLAICNSPMTTANHFAEITITVRGSSTSMGVIARSTSNGSSFYLLRSNGTNWNIFHAVGESFANLGSFAQAPANGDVARLECNETTIKAYVNSIEIISITDSTDTTSLYTGVRAVGSATTRYDNFEGSDIGSFSGGGHKYYNGSAWVDTTPQIWNGSAWVPTAVS